MCPYKTNNQTLESLNNPPPPKLPPPLLSENLIPHQRCRACNTVMVDGYEVGELMCPVCSGQAGLCDEEFMGSPLTLEEEDAALKLLRLFS